MRRCQQLNSAGDSTKSILDDFDRRHIEELEQQFKEIEAIQHYEEVKRGRDDCNNNLKKLANDLKSNTDTIKGLTDDLQICAEELKKLSDVEENVKNLQSKIDELEAIRVAVAGNDATAIPSGQPTKTIQEILGLALRTKEEEIRRRAAELLNPMKAEWEGTEKPRLVFEAAIRFLEESIGTLDRAGVSGSPIADSSDNRQQPQELSELNRTVNAVLRREVQRRIDSEFESRVEAASQRRAQEKIDQLKIEEWPGYVEQNILPKVEELKQRISDNVFSFLRGPWKIQCLICRATKSVQFYAEAVASIVRDGELELECAGGYLKPVLGTDKLNIFAGQQRFKLSLADLIDMQLR